MQCKAWADKMAAMPQNSIDAMNTDQIGMTPADVMQSAALGDIDALGSFFRKFTAHSRY